MPKLEKAEAEVGGSGIPPVVPPPEAPPATPPVKPSEPETDELGYAIVPPPKEEKPPEKKLDKKPEPEKVEVPGTGYGSKAPVVEDPPEAPLEEKKDPLPELDLKPDQIIPKDEVIKVKEFAKAHNLTKEQAQAYLDIRAGETKENARLQAQAVKTAERDRQQLRATWHKELKDDPTFGGDKFDHNVLRAEKVLQDFMPTTKKELTARGSMLPPYVMRDLAKLADHLYSTDKLAQGDPVEPPKEEKEEDDALAFYKLKS